MQTIDLLKNRDYTIIIDRSGSMSIKDTPRGKTRWEEVQESTRALAKKCDELDPDGITVYFFSTRFKRYDNVTYHKVTQIFEENDPMGSSNLAGALQDALDNYFQRKSKGETKPNGETFLVITDGEPNSHKEVINIIINATNKIDHNQEISISFIQVGKDKKASQYLKSLDEELQIIGAKFDIVDTLNIERIKKLSFTEVLINCILN